MANNNTIDRVSAERTRNSKDALQRYKKVKLTYSFNKKILADSNTSWANEESALKNKAKIAGFYFEACVYQALQRLLPGAGRARYNYSPQQKGAIYAFNAHKSLSTLKLQIERAAQLCAENFKKEVEASANSKNYTVKVGTIADLGGKGNPTGDLEIIVNGKRIVLELKWQQTTSAMTHWFSLSDISLFGGAFLNFVRDTKGDIYWNGTVPDDKWQALLGGQGLLDFFNDGLSMNDEALLKYLIQKGEAIKQVNEKPPDAKYVVHGTKSSMTITNLDTIADEVANDVAKARVTTQARPNKFLDKDQIGWLQGQSRIATFGITKFSWPKGTKKEDKTGLTTGFTFDLYLSQKYFNAQKNAL